jgi:hypothetical protein
MNRNSRALALVGLAPIEQQIARNAKQLRRCARMTQ